MKHIKTFESFLNEGEAKQFNSDLSKNPDGIWVLEGGLDKKGNWNGKSLASAEVLYYTKDFRDPKLQDYKEDGMVWVEIMKGEIDVKQY